MNSQQTNFQEPTQTESIRYFQTPYSLLKEEALRKKNNSGQTLSLLGDRMRLSRKNGGKYYDENEGDYFVRFSQPAMAELINFSERSVFSIYKYLEDNKYIRRKHVGYNRPDKIFLTPYTQNLLPGLEKIANPDQKNMPPSNSEGNHREVSHRGNGSSYSVNSEQPQNDSSSQNGPQGNQEASQKSSDSNNTYESTKSRLNRRIQNWRDKVHQSIGLSTNVLMSILNVTDMNTNLGGQVIQWIKNARVNIAKKNHISFQDKKAKFEYNENFDGPLADKVQYIFNAVNKKKMTFENCGKYVTTCLKEFFYDAFGLKFKDRVRPKMSGDGSDNEDSYNTTIDGYKETPVQNGPRIPIFQIK